MAEYTPSDEQVEAEWTAFMSTPDPDNYWDAISEEEAKARWSRWLAAHDARVRRDAAREALDGLAADELARVASIGKHSYPAQIAQGIAQSAWNYKWKHYGGAHPGTED